jgi:hypothetical protein
MMKVVHPSIEAGVRGGLDDSTLQVVIVEDLEGPRVPPKIPRRELGITRPYRAVVGRT